MNSNVYYNPDSKLIDDLLIADALDLVQIVEWMKSNPQTPMIFVPSGELKLRHTSRWPIRNIEGWPSWVRQRIFKSFVDIKSAYLQFIVNALETEIGMMLDRYFPNILNLWYDQNSIIAEIASVLNVDQDIHRKKIKSIIMSLAMGSAVSTKMILNAPKRSSICSSVVEICPFITESQANELTSILKPLMTEFKSARGICDISMPTYFSWEHEKRMILWEYCSRTGVMMHDGLDGIPDEMVDFFNTENIGFYVTAKRSENGTQQ